MRLVHPFPSILDGLVVAGAALVAGADPAVAARLGVSMTALQASIGALNDLVDAPSDRGRKPGKPIPAGLVTVVTARAVVAVGAILGVALAAPSGLGLVALAVVVLAIGYGYDLLAKGTAWSWLPFALGIPLLPVYGWFGATGGLAPWFVAMLPMAALAGAALAVGNARVDIERDRDARTRTVGTALGLDRSWRVLVGLWVATGVMAVASIAVLGGDSPLPTVAVGVGIVVILAATVAARSGSPARRERSWEVQAFGAAVSAVAWILAVA